MLKTSCSSLLAYFRNINFGREGCPNSWEEQAKISVKMEKIANVVIRPPFPSNNFRERGIHHLCLFVTLCVPFQG